MCSLNYQVYFVNMDNCDSSVAMRMSFTWQVTLSHDDVLG